MTANTGPNAAYLGIDPGVKGGLAVLLQYGDVVSPDLGLNAGPMPATEKDVWNWLKEACAGCKNVYAVIEQQYPRPTALFDKKSKTWRSTVLASTCVLYGSYMGLRSMLVAAGVVWEQCPPMTWQKALGIPKKKPAENNTHWKNRLKEKASQLFPEEKMTLAKCDAVLIAEHCRRSREWVPR